MNGNMHLQCPSCGGGTNLKLSNKERYHHEFGHVVGLIHEHERPERNIYIKCKDEVIDEETAVELRKVYNIEY